MVRSWITGSVGSVALARPDSRNAFDRDLARKLHAAIAELASDDAVRCLLLSGDGPSFSVGGDLHVIASQTPQQTVALNDDVLAVADLLERARIPSIAVLHGHVLGAGLEVALGCSLRVAATDARLGLPEARVGLIPASGGVARLAEQVGTGTALRLMLTGEMISGEEARELGLVQFAVESAELSKFAAALAEQIAANAPLAVGAILELIAEHKRSRRGALLERTAERLTGLLTSEDLREGFASFEAKRPARFNGR
jgi:enoyl-CoA hydratase/carnithine racemase